MEFQFLKSSHRAFLRFSIFVFFCSFLSSCSFQNTKKEIVHSSLETIEREPIGHYKALSELSKYKESENDHLDEIVFPRKAHKFTIRLISPAYLERTEIEALIMDIDPPANSSQQTRAELDFLLQLQENRTQEQVNDALRMHDIVYFPLPGMKNEEHLFFVGNEVFNKQLDLATFPKTKNLLNNIMKEMRIAEFTAKNFFLRARPRQLENKLKPLKKMSSSSFASGHTLWAYMQAYLLGTLIPERRNDFLNVAYDIGYSREVLGVHYPSDEEASRILAYELLSKMWNKPQFIKDFNAAKLEWK